MCRPDAIKAAEARGHAHRAAGVGAERGIADPGRDRRRRTRRGAARHPAGSADIDRRAVEGILAQDAERDLVRYGLADQGGAGIEQRLDSPGILCGDRPTGRPVVIAAAGRRARHVEQVFGSEGQARKRPARLALDSRPRAGHERTDFITHAGSLFGRLGLVSLAAEEADLAELHTQEPVEPDVDNRSDEQRQQLRDHEAADHGDAERLAQFGTGAGADRDRQRAEQRAGRGHHDRAEAQEGCLDDRFLGRGALIAALDGKIDHHDGILLHDADQHDHADHGDDAEIHAKQLQGDQRADAGRRQARQNRQRVDEVLIEDAQNDVDHQDGREQQHALIGDRLLKDLSAALEARRDGCRQSDFACHLFDRLHRFAQRHAGSKVEGDHYRRQLGDVVDGERRRLVAALGHGVERHQRAARCADLHAPQHFVGVGISRIGLEDHLVGVVGCIDRRDLAAAER